MKKESYELCWSGPGIFFVGKLHEVLQNDQCLWLRPRAWTQSGKACAPDGEDRLVYVYPPQRVGKEVRLSITELSDDWVVLQPDIVMAEIHDDIKFALCEAVSKRLITIT